MHALMIVTIIVELLLVPLYARIIVIIILNLSTIVETSMHGRLHVMEFQTPSAVQLLGILTLAVLLWNANNQYKRDKNI
jgi:hypothetical protein